ncbi:MAG: glycosyltransferase [candidate division KSB1 bacterium]|nr:glycosyltransferase [candidate division KSB1 bacterium]
MKSAAGVVFLVPGFPKDEEDTECLPLLQNYIFYFSKSRPAIPMAVIAFQYPYFIGKYKWNNITVYSAGGKNRRRGFRILAWLRAVYYFLQLRRQIKVAVIHSFWLDECTFVGQCLAKAFKIKHVATIGGQEVRPSNRYLKYFDFAGMTMTCWSRFSADAFQKVTGQKVEKIIPIGLDHQRVAAVAPAQERKIDILGVGALIPIKNFELFIEIVSELAAEFPGLEVKIIGDGPLHQNLKGLIREKLPGNIQLLGKLPRRQVMKYMAQSKILLHTSSHESQGYVFMEALYCGMTIVSFNVGYLGQTAKAIRCASKEEMLDNLRKLLKQPLNHDRVLLKPIEETVAEFSTLYAL